jgi:hypothetical protein
MHYAVLFSVAQFLLGFKFISDAHIKELNEREITFESIDVISHRHQYLFSEKNKTISFFKITNFFRCKHNLEKKGQILLFVYLMDSLYFP